MPSVRTALAWALVGCDTVVDAAGGDLTVTPSEDVVTVAEFSFVPNDIERTRVEVADDDGALLATDWTEPGTKRVSTRLLALPASSTLTARVVTEGGDELDEAPFTTGGFPSQVPVLQLTGEPGWTGYNFTSALGVVNVAMILDERGNVAWYHVASGESSLSRVRLRPDQLGVTFIRAPGVGSGEQYLSDVDWSSAEERRFAEDLHVTHDFVFLPDGTIGTLATTRVIADGKPRLGGALLEIAPDGSSSVVWDGAETWPDGVTPESEFLGPHVNTITYDSERDWYWWTVQNDDCLLALDRPTSAVQLIIGGSQSDFTFVNDPGLIGPHHISLSGDKVRIHDNRDVDLNSRIVEYQLDHEAKTATFTGEWFHEPPVYDFALGDVNTRDDGSMLVTWSSVGIIDDFGPDGTLRASISGPLGTAFGYGEPHDSLPGQVRLR